MTPSLDRLQVTPVVSAPGIFRNLGHLYCRLFHNAISRPVEGKYRCWKCLREFDLDW
jgi:hypothetical protein